MGAKHYAVPVLHVWGSMSTMRLTLAALLVICSAAQVGLRDSCEKLLITVTNHVWARHTLCNSDHTGTNNWLSVSNVIGLVCDKLVLLL